MRPSTRPVFLRPISLRLRTPFILAAIVFAGCVTNAAAASESQRFTPERAAATDRVVRAFMQTVAHRVTKDGPTAWLKYFDSGPAFFMAVNGQMAFSNAVAAQEGTRKFAKTITHIELKWGDDLLVDPLTADLAIVADSWHEAMVDVAGHPGRTSGILHRIGRVSRGTLAIPGRSLVVTRASLPLVLVGSEPPKLLPHPL